MRETANHKTGILPSLLAVIVFAAIGYSAWCHGRAVLNTDETDEGKALNLGETPTAEISLEELSNIDHGATLAEVMERIRGEDFEITAIFTPNGEKLYEFTEYKDVSVEITNAHVQLIKRYGSGLVFLHNHPVWDQASFSSLDLEMLAGYQAGYGIVVSKNDTYVLLANQKWPDKEKIGEFVRLRPDLTQSIWFKGSSGKLKELPVTTRELMELVAEEYNLSYYEWDKTKVSSEEVAAAILGE